MKAKRRSENQIMEEDSEALVRRLLPRHWVMHEYKPDYGIDFVVEVFDELEGDAANFETAGEIFYVQLKAIKSPEISEVEKYGRSNVEKYENYPDTAESVVLEVLKFRIDVPLLNTVLLMGNATPVLLFVCDLTNDKVYFVCLNDYIEKILYPEKPNFRSQQSVQLEIPTSNILAGRDSENLEILRLFAKRSKFYAEFAKFSYQRHELQYIQAYSILLRFLDINMMYDFWKKPSIWPAINRMPSRMKAVKEIIEELKDLEDKEKIGFGNVFGELDWCSSEEESLSYFYKRNEIFRLWDELANLGNVHEEIVREWFLPTVLAEMCR
ncbi:DUF4365 domain-containing protein [Deinococcus wulumuqiensis]